MNQRDTEMWANWHIFENDEDFQVFRAWALNGSCIQQRMGLFDDVPDSWHRIKRYVKQLNTYEQANMAIINPEYLNLQNLKWTKNVKPNDGSYAYSEHKVSNLFKLTWRDNQENANKPQINDLILLRQYGYVTHLVKVLDSQSAQDGQGNYSTYRIVEVIWTMDCSNPPEFTRANNIFGYPEVLEYQSGNVMELETLPTFRQRWSGEDGLSAFHQHVYSKLLQGIEKQNDANYESLLSNIYGEAVHVVATQRFKDDDGNGKDLFIVREIRRGYYLEILIEYTKNDLSSTYTSHRVLPSFLPLIDGDLETWQKFIAKIEVEDWLALDAIVLYTVTLPSSDVLFAGADVIGSDVSEQALARFGCYYPDEDLLPAFIFESPDYQLTLIIPSSGKNKFASNCMVGDGIDCSRNCFSSLQEAQGFLDRRLSYYMHES